MCIWHAQNLRVWRDLFQLGSIFKGETLQALLSQVFFFFYKINKLYITIHIPSCGFALGFSAMKLYPCCLGNPNCHYCHVLTQICIFGNIFTTITNTKNLINIFTITNTENLINIFTIPNTENVKRITCLVGEIPPTPIC